jgi:SAM-dependent methyltransferase
MNPEFLRALRSPLTGRLLRQVSEFALSDGEHLWPCLRGIPYLRANRDGLRAAAIREIEAGHPEEALALLLTDRRDEAIPSVELASTRLATKASCITEAMQLLNYGGMAPYIFHRWSLPTFISGLALLEAHAPAGASLFEVGCGAGHLLRAWTEASGTAIGADLVFSNLWLARRFVAPDASLVCCDVTHGFPFADAIADVAFCHDAFHYFTDKALAVAEMKRVSSTGILLLGHVHNAAVKNFSPGTPLERPAYEDLLKPDFVYDDADLTRAAMTGSPPKPMDQAGDRNGVQAFAFVSGPVPQGRSTLTVPRPGASLRVNPLIAGDGVPLTPQLTEEFVDCWEFMRAMRAPPKHLSIKLMASRGTMTAELETFVRRRLMVHLPEDWM